MTRKVTNEVSHCLMLQLFVGYCSEHLEMKQLSHIFASLGKFLGGESIDNIRQSFRCSLNFTKVPIIAEFVAVDEGDNFPVSQVKLSQFVFSSVSLGFFSCKLLLLIVPIPFLLEDMSFSICNNSVIKGCVQSFHINTNVRF